MDCEQMMLVLSSVGVALVVFILYALERRGKGESIRWEDAMKLSLFGGAITAGVVFAVTADTSNLPVIKDVVETVTDSAQEIFLGQPTF